MKSCIKGITYCLQGAMINMHNIQNDEKNAKEDVW